MTDSTTAPPHVSAFSARCRAGLERAQALLPTITEATGPRTVANTLEPYNELLMHLERSAGEAGLMSAVHPDEAIRDAARGAEQAVDAFMSKLRLDRGLYEAFAALDTADMDAESRRLVEHTLRDFHRAGVDRDDDTRARLEQIDEELTRLGQSFQKNIIDDVRHIMVDREALSGLPQDFISARTKADGDSSADDVRISTDYPDYMPFMSYADRHDLRKELYIAFKARGGQDNEDILRQILTLRAEKAALLGYANWADYATEDKMMKSGANARAFIERVAGVAAKRAERDYHELLDRKRQDHPDADEVADYEKTYYENKVKAERYAFDPQSVRPYFPYRQVERGLLDITARIYDISYEAVADAEVWHPDVKVFDVVRAGARLGRIYLDMHPREGKYKHAAQFPYRSGIADAQVPEGVLVCNFAKPGDAGEPALMEHSDVVTMFHEFGHLMHHVLGGQKRWLPQSGVATEWDFVEAPSQMFEEWAWQHETLRSFAKHYDSGEEIPAEMVDRMRAADKFGLGVATVQQMFYAAISLAFHTTDPAELDMHDTVRRLQAQYTPFRFVDGTRFHANFGHLHGYSALYYTYMWSLVIAKDLLTPFHEHGLMDTEWTHRYRDRILAPGGSKDASALVHDFLGREFSFEAFESYLAG
ncbi:M3 family metallopeptidase [Haliangium sp.]|uniref:M3 family metallopeptidase n=1 Tax=Haliangium sp. TaxID=2663208 RepID=UPI003D0B361F